MMLRQRDRCCHGLGQWRRGIIWCLREQNHEGKHYGVEAGSEFFWEGLLLGMPCIAPDE